MSTENRAALAQKAVVENAWFTEGNVTMALNGILELLDENRLERWVAQYQTEPPTPRQIAVVMAGNIPAVGFHDLLCVLLSGHRILIKYSTRDRVVLNTLIEMLTAIAPDLGPWITTTDGTLKGFDAVIATGSDNAGRYFQYYFSKFPSIIRKNRIGVAILSGNDSAADLEALGLDVFSYFGLGCRNVAKLFVPSDYDFGRLFETWAPYYEKLIDHNKYGNNYDYRKSILLVNGSPHLDTGFVLLEETSAMVSPIATLYYERYPDEATLTSILERHKEKTQCIVGAHKLATVGFGTAQFPGAYDYADGIDTMHFLEGL